MIFYISLHTHCHTFVSASMLVYVHACVWVCLRVREGVWVWEYVVWQ